jgi:hypothetical protein
MSGRDLAAYEAAMANSQTGRSINDKDLALHREMLNLGRGMSDSDANYKKLYDKLVKQ